MKTVLPQIAANLDYLNETNSDKTLRVAFGIQIYGIATLLSPLLALGSICLHAYG